MVSQTPEAISTDTPPALERQGLTPTDSITDSTKPTETTKVAKLIHAATTDSTTSNDEGFSTCAKLSRAVPAPLILNRSRVGSSNSTPNKGHFPSRSHAWLDDMLASNLETPERLFFDSQFAVAPMSAQSTTGFQIPELDTEASCDLKSPPRDDDADAEDHSESSNTSPQCESPLERSPLLRFGYSDEEALDEEAGLGISNYRSIEFPEDVLLSDETIVPDEDEKTLEQQLDLDVLDEFVEEDFQPEIDELARSVLECEELEIHIESLYSEPLPIENHPDSSLSESVDPARLMNSINTVPQQEQQPLRPQQPSPAWQAAGYLTDNSSILHPSEGAEASVGNAGNLFMPFNRPMSSFEPFQSNYYDAMPMNLYSPYGPHPHAQPLMNTLPISNPMSQMSRGHPAYAPNGFPMYGQHPSQGPSFNMPPAGPVMMARSMGRPHNTMASPIWGPRSAGFGVERPSHIPPFVEAPHTPVLQTGNFSGGGLMTPHTTPHGFHGPARDAQFVQSSTEISVDGRLYYLLPKDGNPLESINSKPAANVVRPGTEALKRVTRTPLAKLIKRTSETFLRNVSWFELFPLVPGWMLEGPANQLYLVYGNDKLALPVGSVPSTTLIAELAQRPELFHQKSKDLSIGTIKCRCNGCAFSSTDYKDLAQHYDLKHLEKVPPSTFLYCFDRDCPFSIFGFTSLTNYRRHLRCNHNIDISDRSDTACQKCYQSFERPGLFWRHYWMCRVTKFTGVKPPSPPPQSKSIKDPKSGKGAANSKKASTKAGSKPKGQRVTKTNTNTAQKKKSKVKPTKVAA